MFSPGQLVWAKMRGYPPWPAGVSSLKSKQTFLCRLALWNSTLSFAVFLSPFRLIFLHQKKECMQKICYLLFRNTRNIRTHKLFCSLALYESSLHNNVCGNLIVCTLLFTLLAKILSRVFVIFPFSTMIDQFTSLFSVYTTSFYNNTLQNDNSHWV